MTNFFTLFFSFVFALNLSAQVSGKITDTAGEPLIGVSISVKGTNAGTISDIEGAFRVAAPADAVLVFVYTGFETQEVPVAGQNTINVVLTENFQLLDQVVVVGYGVQKKKDLTTAVVTIDEKDIRDRPMVSAAEALQGKAAGVQVVQPSGKPGNDIAVRVRGATSVLAGNEPLYVVDGVPTTDIRGLNPADIESLSVLKDASSAAIYGARAANGVVLITTNGAKREPQMSGFPLTWGFPI